SKVISPDFSTKDEAKSNARSEQREKSTGTRMSSMFMLSLLPVCRTRRPFSIHQAQASPVLHQYRPKRAALPDLCETSAIGLDSCTQCTVLLDPCGRTTPKIMD